MLFVFGSRHATVGHLSSCLGLVSSRDPDLWHMTLTFEADLDTVKENQHAKYL